MAARIGARNRVCQAFVLDKMQESESLYTITAVEREVGLSKDVLRVWERRYGFPAPQRGARGDRVYTGDEVARLRLVKRLMDSGHRPGKLLAQPLEDLQALAAAPALARHTGEAEDAAPAAADELLGCVAAHDAAGLARALHQQLAQVGLQRFVQDILAPLTGRVGEEWARGGIGVFEEHLFTEVAVRLLRQAIAAVPPGDGATILLTTAPDEPHGLGLLMVESLLVLQGARCINLGTQLPLLEIVRAAQAYRAGVVGLSFSSAFNTRRIPDLLRQLRSELAADVELWAGGEGMRRVPRIDGVRALASLQDVLSAA